MREVSDVIQLRGAIEFALANAETGEILQSGRVENTVASNGRKWILNRIGSNDSSVIDRIYLGTGTTPADSTQTALVSSAASKTATISNVGTSNNPPYITATCSWASNETFTSSTNPGIREFGLFTANATMVGRYVSSTYILFDTSNTLSVTYTLSN